MERSLRPQLAQSLSEQWESKSTEEYGWDGEFLGYEILGEVSDDDIDHALAMLRDTMQRPEQGEVVAALATMRATTLSRAADTDDVSLAFAAYANVLMRYPRDCVLSAIEYWGENEKFWPSLVELKIVVERRARRRMSLRKALLNARRHDRGD